MIQITSEQVAFAREFIPKIDEYLRDNDLDELLLALNFAIVEFGLDEKQDKITKKGIKLQNLYDEIYYQNKGFRSA